MDLELSEEQAELRDNVRDVLAGVCPPSVVRAVYDQTGDPSAVWEKMVELYWPALGIAEDEGGLGMSFVELALVAEELGRAVVPSPFLATTTQFVPAIRELGDQDQRKTFLGRVATGEITGTLALAEGGSWRPDAVQATATWGDGGWVLSGTKQAVLDGATADEVVVIARMEGDLAGFVVPGSSLLARRLEVIDPTMPLAELTLDGVVVPTERVLLGDDVERVVEEATVALAAATVGSCRMIYEMTLDYAKEREQYGRVIGSFQALKHRFAELYLAVERATALSYFAALTIAEEDPRRAEAASLAKSAAGDCQRLLARDGLQLHGGIGFTWEHDLHFWLKRAKAGDALFGSAAHHRARLAEVLGVAS